MITLDFLLVLFIINIVIGIVVSRRVNTLRAEFDELKKKHGNLHNLLLRRIPKLFERPKVITRENDNNVTD